MDRKRPLFSLVAFSLVARQMRSTNGESELRSVNSKIMGKADIVLSPARLCPSFCLKAALACRGSLITTGAA